MNWKDIASDVAKVAPFLGGAIAGPAGAGVGSLIASALGVANTPSDVQTALLTDPDAAVNIKTIEAQVQIAQITAASQQVQAVNQTLQTEAMGGSFWQRNHHAYESSFVCLLIAAMYVGLPLAKVPVPNVDPTVWLMLG